MRAPAAALAGLVLAVTFGTSAAERIALAPQRIAADVYYFQGEPGVASAKNRAFNSNAGFVVTREGVVVIDALGSPALGEAMIRAIRKVTAQPIRKVVITHYHADHFYGLQAFKKAGAEVWAHSAGRAYLEGGEGAARLEQRRRDLKPWIDANTRLVPADVWLDGDGAFTLGGVRFELVYLGPAHAPDDLMVIVGDSGVVFVGDLMFTGRIPFVGEADSRRWLETIGALQARAPKWVVSGHGKPSTDPQKDLALTREYLIFLREAMGKAVEDFVPFEEAYARTDWSRYAKLPAFEAANRINAYGTYLLMEKESLAKQR